MAAIVLQCYSEAGLAAKIDVMDCCRRRCRHETLILESLLGLRSGLRSAIITTWLDASGHL